MRIYAKAADVASDELLLTYVKENLIKPEMTSVTARRGAHDVAIAPRANAPRVAVTTVGQSHRSGFLRPRRPIANSA
jgi:hypothetical protein